MTPALHPSFVPKSPARADRSADDADERLPAPQALMVIVALATMCWLVVGALVAWLVG